MRIFTWALIGSFCFLLAACGSSGGGAPPRESAQAAPAGAADTPVVVDTLPQYAPLTEVFADPLDIVREPDPPTILLKLRRIASPTPRYHKDLLDVLTASERIDLAHLRVLVAASYFPYDAFVREDRALAAIGEPRDPERKRYREKLARDRALALTLAPDSNRLIEVGITKLAALDVDGALALLHDLYPGLGATRAFEAAMQRLPGIPAEKKLRLVDLAIEKEETGPAVSLATDWFQHDSDRGAKTLLSLASRVGAEGRDSLLVGCVSLIQQADGADVLALARLSPRRAGEVAGIAYARNRQYVPDEATRMARELEPAERPSFFVHALDGCNRLTSAQLEEMLGAIPAQRATVAKKALAHLSDLDAGAAVRVASHLRAKEIDLWLEVAVDRLSQLTTSELSALINASYEGGKELAFDELPKVTDLTVANAVILAQWFSGTTKDELLLKAVDLVKDLNRESLETLVELADQYGDDIRGKGIQRLTQALGPSSAPAVIPPLPKP